VPLSKEKSIILSKETVKVKNPKSYQITHWLSKLGKKSGDEAGYLTGYYFRAGFVVL